MRMNPSCLVRGQLRGSPAGRIAFCNLFRVFGFEWDIIFFASITDFIRGNLSLSKQRSIIESLVDFIARKRLHSLNTALAQAIRQINEHDPSIWNSIDKCAIVCILASVILHWFARPIAVEMNDAIGPYSAAAGANSRRLPKVQRIMNNYFIRIIFLTAEKLPASRR